MAVQEKFELTIWLVKSTMVFLFTREQKLDFKMIQGPGFISSYRI